MLSSLCCPSNIGEKDDNSHLNFIVRAQRRTIKDKGSPKGKGLDESQSLTSKNQIIVHEERNSLVTLKTNSEVGCNSNVAIDSNSMLDFV